MTAPTRFAFDENFRTVDTQDAVDVAAHRQSRDIEAVAYARGFDDGRSSEEAAAARLLAEAAGAVSNSLVEVEGLVDARLSALEEDAAALALSFAQTLTLGLVPDTALVEETFRLALRDLTETLALTVTLNPRVLTNIDDRLSAMASGVNPKARIRLISDRTMPPGDCRIEWPRGEIAADRTAREQRLAALLARAFPKSPTAQTESLP